MTRWGMAIDLRRCVGCQTCTIACKQAHNLPPGVFWRRVLDCETGSYPNVQRTFLPLACMHCTDAPCLEVCPTTATRQRADGIVTIDADICVGCAYCVVACPYEARTIMADEVPYFAAGPTPAEVALADPGRVGTCTKCDLCVDRVEAGLDPVCVTSCIGGAMTFGDLDDPKSPVARLLREQESARPLADLGLGPAVAYVGAPAGETLVPPRRQRVWGWQAVANFSLGGIGAGVYLVGPASVRWVGPLLVGLGLLALTTEAGRPLRGLNLFRHLGRSWMSREALAAAIFLPLAMVGLHLAASLAAAAFMISQGFIVRRARGVTAWDSPLVPLVFVASGLAGGTGLALVITGGGFPLLAAVVSLAAWLAYLRPRGGEFDAATQELRSLRWLGLVVGLGHLAPLLLMPLAPRLAGLLLVAGSVAVKAGIVARAGFLRGIRF